MNKNVFKVLAIVTSVVSIHLKAQTPYTKYFCELDTSFNGKEALSNQSLIKNSPWGADHKTKSLSQPSGTIQGATINRSGNFKYYTGSSNIKTFDLANLYTTHNFDSAGIKSAAIGKSELLFTIGTNAKLNKFSYLTYSADLNPKPIQFGKIELGTTNYQTSNSRGNVFSLEQYFKNNSALVTATKDTFTNNNSISISPSSFPGDNSDYSTILGKLNSAEFTGWFIEIDRLDNTFQKRRFDLGRAPRKAFIINSNRQTGSGSLATVNRTYQILGNNELNLLVKTELNNNVQEFYVYSEEENTLSSHWTLINEVSSGKIQSLSKNALMDLFNYIVTNPNFEVTYFLNVTDVDINETTNTLLLTSPGGVTDITSFKNKYQINHEPVVASYLTPLLTGSVFTDKFGQIIEIDGDDIASTTKLGFTTSTGKFVSNISNLALTNLNYIDEKSDPQNTSFAILSENIFDNSEGQNPAHKKNATEWQNEVFLVNLDALTSNGKVDIGSKNFELFQTLANNSTIIPTSYTETYIPSFYISKNLNNQIDSFSFIRGFADYFISPVACKQNTATEDLEKISNINLVYPNPLNCSTGDCNIHLKHTDKISIYTIQGQFILATDKTDSVNLERLSTGMYIIRGNSGWSEIIIKN